MVLEVQQKTTTVYVNEPIQTGSNTVTESVSIMDDAGVTAGTMNTEEVNTKEQELYIQLKNALGIENISQDNIKKLLESYFKKPIAEIIVDNKKDNTFKDLLKEIEKFAAKTIEIAKKHNKSITREEAVNKAIVRIAHDYEITENFGFSVETLKRYRQQNSESLGERIERFYDFKKKGLSWENLNNDEKLKYIERYFVGYFKDNSNKQIADFNKLLINTPEEDQELFLKIAPKLLSENKCRGALNVINSQSTQEGRTNIANQVSYEYVFFELIAHPDENGKYVSQENAQELLIVAAKSQDTEHIEENLNQANKSAEILFTEENVKRYEKLKEKIDNGEEISKEDMEFVREYEFQPTFRSSQMIGTANSDVISDKNEIKELLTQMNNDAKEYANPVYEEVLNQVNKYVESHQDTLKMSKNDFNDLMDKVTGGKYSTIAHASTSNNGSSQASTSTSGGQNTSTNSGMFATVPKDRLEQQFQIVDSLVKTINAPKEETPILVEGSFENRVLVNNVDWINKELNDIGIVKFTRYVLNSSNARGSLAFDKGLNFLERCVGGFKEVMYAGIHNTTNACIALRKSFSPDELKDVKAQNVYVAQQLKEMQKDNA